MIALFYILAVIFCCILLFFSAELLIGAMSRIAKFLGLKEFVVAFFVMAVAGSLPNLFVDVSAAFQNLSELAFGEIVGGNVFDLCVTAGLAILFARDGIQSRGGTIQTSAIFTIVSAVLPLFLILDGNLSRVDGLILIAFFLFYIFWLFSKKERFTKVYEKDEKLPPLQGFKTFIFDIAKVSFALGCLLLVSNFIVDSVKVFSNQFNLPVALIGLFIVGISNCMPELYFSLNSARKGETNLILGDLMGSVIIPPTLVLGLVALINPFTISNFSIYALARVATFAAAVLFLIFIRTDRWLNKKEAVGLLSIFIIWLIAEVFRGYSI